MDSFASEFASLTVGAAPELTEQDLLLLVGAPPDPKRAKFNSPNLNILGATAGCQIQAADGSIWKIAEGEIRPCRSEVDYAIRYYKTNKILSAEARSARDLLNIGDAAFVELLHKFLSEMVSVNRPINTQLTDRLNSDGPVDQPSCKLVLVDEEGFKSKVGTLLRIKWRQNPVTVPEILANMADDENNLHMFDCDKYAVVAWPEGGRVRWEDKVTYSGTDRISVNLLGLAPGDMVKGVTDETKGIVLKVTQGYLPPCKLTVQNEVNYYLVYAELSKGGQHAYELIKDRVNGPAELVQMWQAILRSDDLVVDRKENEVMSVITPSLGAAQRCTFSVPFDEDMTNWGKIMEYADHKDKLDDFLQLTGETRIVNDDLAKITGRDILKANEYQITELGDGLRLWMTVQVPSVVSKPQAPSVFNMALPTVTSPASGVVVPPADAIVFSPVVSTSSSSSEVAPMRQFTPEPSVSATTSAAAAPKVPKEPDNSTLNILGAGAGYTLVGTRDKPENVEFRVVTGVIPPSRKVIKEELDWYHDHDKTWSKGAKRAHALIGNDNDLEEYLTMLYDKGYAISREPGVPLTSPLMVGKKDKDVSGITLQLIKDPNQKKKLLDGIPVAQRDTAYAMIESQPFTWETDLKPLFTKESRAFSASSYDVRISGTDLVQWRRDYGAAQWVKPPKPDYAGTRGAKPKRLMHSLIIPTSEPPAVIVIEEDPEEHPVSSTAAFLAAPEPVVEQPTAMEVEQPEPSGRGMVEIPLSPRSSTSPPPPLVTPVVEEEVLPPSSSSVTPVEEPIPTSSAAAEETATKGPTEPNNTTLNILGAGQGYTLVGTRDKAKDAKIAVVTGVMPPCRAVVKQELDWYREQRKLSKGAQRAFELIGADFGNSETNFINYLTWLYDKGFTVTRLATKSLTSPALVGRKDGEVSGVTIQLEDDPRKKLLDGVSSGEERARLYSDIKDHPFTWEGIEVKFTQKNGKAVSQPLLCTMFDISALATNGRVNWEEFAMDAWVKPPRLGYEAELTAIPKSSKKMAAIVRETTPSVDVPMQEAVPIRVVEPTAEPVAVVSPPTPTTEPVSSVPAPASEPKKPAARRVALLSTTPLPAASAAAVVPAKAKSSANIRSSVLNILGVKAGKRIKGMFKSPAEGAVLEITQGRIQPCAGTIEREIKYYATNKRLSPTAREAWSNVDDEYETEEMFLSKYLNPMKAKGPEFSVARAESSTLTDSSNVFNTPASETSCHFKIIQPGKLAEHANDNNQSAEFRELMKRADLSFNEVAPLLGTDRQEALWCNYFSLALPVPEPIDPTASDFKYNYVISLSRVEIYFTSKLVKDKASGKPLSPTRMINEIPFQYDQNDSVVEWPSLTELVALTKEPEVRQEDVDAIRTYCQKLPLPILRACLRGLMAARPEAVRFPSLEKEFPLKLVVIIMWLLEFRHDGAFDAVLRANTRGCTQAMFDLVLFGLFYSFPDGVWDMGIIDKTTGKPYRQSMMSAACLFLGASLIAEHDEDYTPWRLVGRSLETLMALVDNTRVLVINDLNLKAEFPAESQLPLEVDPKNRTIGRKIIYEILAQSGPNDRPGAEQSRMLHLLLRLTQRIEGAATEEEADPLNRHLITNVQQKRPISLPLGIGLSHKHFAGMIYALAYQNWKTVSQEPGLTLEAKYGNWMTELIAERNTRLSTEWSEDQMRDLEHLTITQSQVLELIVSSSSRKDEEVGEGDLMGVAEEEELAEAGEESDEEEEEEEETTEAREAALAALAANAEEEPVAAAPTSGSYPVKIPSGLVSSAIGPILFEHNKDKFRILASLDDADDVRVIRQPLYSGETDLTDVTNEVKEAAMTYLKSRPWECKSQLLSDLLGVRGTIKATYSAGHNTWSFGYGESQTAEWAQLASRKEVNVPLFSNQVLTLEDLNNSQLLVKATSRKLPRGHDPKALMPKIPEGDETKRLILSRVLSFLTTISATRTGVAGLPSVQESGFTPYDLEAYQMLLVISAAWPGALKPLAPPRFRILNMSVFLALWTHIYHLCRYVPEEEAEAEEVKEDKDAFFTAMQEDVPEAEEEEPEEVSAEPEAAVAMEDIPAIEEGSQENDVVFMRKLVGAPPSKDTLAALMTEEEDESDDEDWAPGEEDEDEDYDSDMSIDSDHGDSDEEEEEKPKAKAKAKPKGFVVNEAPRGSEKDFNETEGQQFWDDLEKRGGGVRRGGLARALSSIADKYGKLVETKGPLDELPKLKLKLAQSEFDTAAGQLDDLVKQYEHDSRHYANDLKEAKTAAAQAKLQTERRALDEKKLELDKQRELVRQLGQTHTNLMKEYGVEYQELGDQAEIIEAPVELKTVNKNYIAEANDTGIVGTEWKNSFVPQRKLREHQREIVDMMQREARSHKTIHFVNMIPGTGKTQIAVSYIRRLLNKHPERVQYVLWIAPDNQTNAIHVTKKEAALGDTSILQELQICAVKDVNEINVTDIELAPHRFNLIKREDLINNELWPRLLKIMPRTIIVVDETHMYYGSNIPTNRALQLASLSHDAIAMSGTAVKSMRNTGVMKWISLAHPCVPIHQYNWLISLTSTVSAAYDDKIEVKELRHDFVVPPKNIKKASADYFENETLDDYLKAGDLDSASKLLFLSSVEVVIREVVAILIKYRINILLVLDDEDHMAAVEDAFHEYQSASVASMGKKQDKSDPIADRIRNISLGTGEDAMDKDINIIMVLKTDNHGYNWGTSRGMIIELPYMISVNNRRQMLGRLKRMGQMRDNIFRLTLVPKGTFLEDAYNDNILHDKRAIKTMIKRQRASVDKT